MNEFYTNKGGYRRGEKQSPVDDNNDCCRRHRDRLYRLCGLGRKLMKGLQTVTRLTKNSYN